MEESRLPTRILQYSKLHKGELLTAQGLLHLGNRSSLDQALARLTKAGQLIRITRGCYFAPVKSRFGTHPPELFSLLESLATRRGETIAQHGAKAANAFGLTTQVPVREIYLTSGPSRQLIFEGQTVELHHAPSWQLLLPNQVAGEFLRALAWLGKEESKAAIPRLKPFLSPKDLADLRSVFPRLPGWLAAQLSHIVLPN